MTSLLLLLLLRACKFHPYLNCDAALPLHLQLVQVLSTASQQLVHVSDDGDGAESVSAQRVRVSVVPAPGPLA